MKRVYMFTVAGSILAIAVLTMLAVQPLQAEQQVCLIIDGQIQHMNDEPPYYHENGEIMVPLRYIAERTGGQVYWDGATDTVAVYFPGRTIWAQLGNNVIMVDNQPVEVEVAPHLVHGRAMVPLSFMSAHYPAHFAWDEAISVLSIDNFVEMK